ncbi:MAG: hypothetical protein JXJ04_18290 [Spirochaetales bacterium]|nr:hypothetical protein [Spirochaetales bacterium]
MLMNEPESRKIAHYYNEYSDYDVVFNHSVIASTGLIAQRVSLKCLNESYPCILYLGSMKVVKILLLVKAFFFEHLQKANNKVILRLFFMHPDSKREISFFIQSRVKNYDKYHGSNPQLYLFSLEYLYRPPDDFILILGKHIKKETENEKRFQQRITINDTNQLEFGIHAMETFLFISGNGKKCILNEISIFSAKVLIEGLPEDYMNQRVILIMKMEELKEMGEMVGIVTRCDIISRQEHLVSLIITFDQDAIPPLYKMWIGQCLETIALKQKKKK